jgi:4a-hydroxytetrahydrobiopterin dehydratase
MADVIPREDLRERLAGLPGVVPAAAGSIEVAVRAPSFGAAVRLIRLVAERAEAMDHHPDVDLRWRTVGFTLSTHSAGGVTDQDLELAGQILAAGQEVGAEVVDPAPRVEIGIDCVDADAIRDFWRVGLGYREQATSDGTVELHDPAGRGPVVWFQPMDPPRRERSRLHLDVHVAPQRAWPRVQELVAAGGTVLTDRFAPSWWVLADAEGNELCVCTTGDAPAGPTGG